MLQVSPSTIYAWAKLGVIPARRIAGIVRFDPDELAAWLAAHRTGPSIEAGEQDQARTA